MSRKPTLALVAQPQAYFHELITAALKHQRLRTKPETEFYLVNLLNQFMTTDNLYPVDGRGNHQEEALAIMMKDAIETIKPEEQRALFRRVGDFSLYVAGFFQDSLRRKVVDVDYYIGMGGNAYKQVAARVEEAARVLYHELAEKFSCFVDVFAEVSDKTTGRSEKDLLRMYDLWVRTRSERAASALRDAGILPNLLAKKKLQ